MALFVGSERQRGKQVENKGRHFEEVARGKYARTRVCLTMKTTDLKRFMLRFVYNVSGPKVMVVSIVILNEAKHKTF